ncbi:MAG: class B sortase [Anaerovoracaceae bacterium]|jgi:sortase B
MRSEKYIKKDQKKKKRTGILYRIVMLILIIIIAFCLYKIIPTLYGYYQGTHTYHEIEKIAGTDKDEIGINWQKLHRKYKNVKAWIYSKDTVINYPVVQGDDNSYYLTHLVNGEYNVKGSIFIDYRNKRPFKDFMTIIYGHHMHDGSMFCSLKNYREKDYYKKHKTMRLYTPDAKYQLQIFGVVTIPSTDKHYKFSFTESEKGDYLRWIERNTELDTEVPVSTDDKIVMLSTCTYEFDEARLVVFAKMNEVNSFE